jgi:hypothetical protein
MAIVQPDFENIARLKVKPTEGELWLLKALHKSLDDSYRVYFQPFLNGDMPDIIVVRENCGVSIVEVKDWTLSAYSVSPKNNWRENKSRARIKSPFQQVFKYKKNMFDMHIDGLAEHNVHNPNFWRIISVFIFFYGSDRQDIDRLYREAETDIQQEIQRNGDAFKSKSIDYSRYEKRDNYLRSQLNKISRDKSLAITTRDIKKIGRKLERDHVLFTPQIYDEFNRYLQPPTHVLEQGIPITYSASQLKYIKSEPGFQKIKGMAGTGKTAILAKRAVNAHKRHGDRVLILTFNKTLRNYVHDRISDVRETFSWGNFGVNNYHNLMTIVLNRVGIKIRIPDGLRPREVSDYLDDHYYSNERIFDGYESGIYKYPSIFIDEVQDYKPAWIRIVRKYFLEDDGEMVLYGDDGQNIYERETETQSKVLVQGFGRWGKLTKPHRQKEGSPIIDLSMEFQSQFLSKKYEIDSYDVEPQLNVLPVSMFKYSYYDEHDLMSVAEQIRHEVKFFNISPNDICVVGSRIKITRGLDYHMRQLFNEKTDTTFETEEAFLKLLERYEDEKDPQLETDLETIRSSKKFAFHSNSGKMKLSTVHSYKGLEAPTLFYLLSENDHEEIVYSAITREKYNLMLFLPSESDFNQFFIDRLAAG